METYEKIYLELEKIFLWLEETSDWIVYITSVTSEHMYIEFHLSTHKVFLIINLHTYEINYNTKLKLNSVESITDLILELRLYWDRVYKNTKRRKRSMKMFEDYINKKS